MVPRSGTNSGVGVMKPRFVEVHKPNGSRKKFSTTNIRQLFARTRSRRSNKPQVHPNASEPGRSVPGPIKVWIKALQR